MSLAITELELTDLNTISIPTDAIMLLSLLIIFALLGYFFHNILNIQTNQYVEKVGDNSNLELVKEKLEDQLIIETALLNQERVERPRTKKLNFITPSKLLVVSSLAVIAGGASLLGVQGIQNSYKGANKNQVNIKTKNQLAKNLISMVKLKSLDKAQNQIKKIRYVDPLLSRMNRSTNNVFYQLTAKQNEDFFSF